MGSPLPSFRGGLLGQRVEHQVERNLSRAADTRGGASGEADVESQGKREEDQLMPLPEGACGPSPPWVVWRWGRGLAH